MPRDNRFFAIDIGPGGDFSFCRRDPGLRRIICGQKKRREYFENVKAIEEYQKRRPFLVIHDKACSYAWKSELFKKMLSKMPYRSINKAPMEAYLNCQEKRWKYTFGDSLFYTLQLSSQSGLSNYPKWLEDVPKYPWLLDAVISLTANLRTIARKTDRLRAARKRVLRDYRLLYRAKEIEEEIKRHEEIALPLLKQVSFFYHFAKDFLARNVIPSTEIDDLMDQAEEVSQIIISLNASPEEMAEGVEELIQELKLFHLMLSKNE